MFGMCAHSCSTEMCWQQLKQEVVKLWLSWFLPLSLSTNSNSCQEMVSAHWIYWLSLTFPCRDVSQTCALFLRDWSGHSVSHSWVGYADIWCAEGADDASRAHVRPHHGRQQSFCWSPETRKWSQYRGRYTWQTSRSPAGKTFYSEQIGHMGLYSILDLALSFHRTRLGSCLRTSSVWSLMRLIGFWKLALRKNLSWSSNYCLVRIND